MAEKWYNSCYTCNTFRYIFEKYTINQNLVYSDTDILQKRV